MGFINIRNKKGTTRLAPPGYSSWLDFWEKNKGRKATECLVYGCSGASDLGGHVIKAGEGGKEYILPICYSCNNKPDGATFMTLESNLVPVT